MKKSELKIMAMETCFLSDLSSKDKKKHLDYIKEADTYQCIGYILDGKFYNLNEMGKQELKKRFIKEQTARKTAHSVVGAAAGTLGGVFAGYRVLKAMFDQCTRACGVFGLNTVKRQYCMLNCKIRVKQREISEVQKMMSQCNQTGNPEKCKQGLMKKMEKAKNQLAGLTQQLAKAKQYMVQKGKSMEKGNNVQPGKTKLI